MIARYTRRELGDAWSDHARFEAMRQVEVAACEEMDGPTAAELEAIRAATFTVQAIDSASFRDTLATHAPVIQAIVADGVARSRRMANALIPRR